MATSANGDIFTLPQYGGMVVEGIPNVTPMLSLISRNSGGLQLPNSGIASIQGVKLSWENEPQRGVTNQDGALEGATPTSRNNVMTQEYNVMQIFQEGFELTYSRMSSIGTLQSGSSATLINGTPIGAAVTQKDKQTASAVRALSRAINYQLHNGTRTMPSNNSSNRIMGGSRTLASNWVTNLEQSALTKALFTAWLMKGFNLGGLRGAGPYVCFCDAITKDKIYDLFGANRVLPSGKVANISLDFIETTYGQIWFVLDPAVYTYSCELIDLSEWALYGMPTIDPDSGASKGIFFLEAMARTASKQQWQIYGEISAAFGHADHIGRLYNIGGTSAAPTAY